MSNEIETNRLFLRPLTEADATQAYVDWLNDPAINQYLETRHALQTIDSCRTFVRRCNEDASSRLFGIFLSESGAHIGNAKLGFMSPQYARAELSLFIGEKTLWGKGLASEVAHSLTGYGFGRLGLERIQAGCYEENLASLRVFLKVGYIVEGFFRSHVVCRGRRSGCFWLGILKHEFV